MLFLLITKALGGCGIESWRLNAAGSMSGILGGIQGSLREEPARFKAADVAFAFLAERVTEESI